MEITSNEKVLNEVEIIPTGDNVLIKMEKESKEYKTQSGIIIQTNEYEKVKRTQGQVVAIGRGRILPNGERVGHEVHEGDNVMFNKFSGVKIATENDCDYELLLIKENDILAIIK